MNFGFGETPGWDNSEMSMAACLAEGQPGKIVRFKAKLKYKTKWKKLIQPTPNSCCSLISTLHTKKKQSPEVYFPCMSKHNETETL